MAHPNCILRLSNQRGNTDNLSLCSKFEIEYIVFIPIVLFPLIILSFGTVRVYARRYAAPSVIIY